MNADVFGNNFKSQSIHRAKKRKPRFAIHYQMYQFLSLRTQLKKIKTRGQATSANDHDKGYDILRLIKLTLLLHFITKIWYSVPKIITCSFHYANSANYVGSKANRERLFDFTSVVNNKTIAMIIKDGHNRIGINGNRYRMFEAEKMSMRELQQWPRQQSQPPTFRNPSRGALTIKSNLDLCFWYNFFLIFVRFGILLNGTIYNSGLGKNSTALF